MSKKLIWIVVLLLIALVPVHAQGDYEPEYQPDACPMPIPAGETEGDTLDCGYLIVPEDRSDPGGQTIALAVAILHSPDALPDPLIYLAGGPGGSALTEADAWTNSPFRAERDIILIDQRGTGYSEPTLDCDEYADQDDPDAACYQGLLDQGINLSAYNSRENAADIADLRVALGLDEVNLYGISYGTRLALTIMRDHPDGIRSVVLDSTYPPQANGFDEGAVNGADAIENLFAACADDAACSAAYGDLESQFFALVDDWNNTPVTTQDAQTGDETEVTGDDLVNLLFQTMYASSAIPTLPYGIYLLSNSDTTMGLEVLNGTYTISDLETLASGEDLPEPDVQEVDDSVYIPDGDSEGMFNSVECNEEAPFNSLEGSQQMSADLPPELYNALQGSTEAQFDTCAYWDSGTADPIETQPVESDIPTLVLAGSLDPTTPAAWGQMAADHLSNSTYAEVPYGGHGEIDAGQCPVNIGLAFLDDPGSAPDISCLNTMNFQFYVPAACTVTAYDGTIEYAAPDPNSDQVGELSDGDSFNATGMSDDGQLYWLRSPDDTWVSEDQVDYQGDCFMLPFPETE